MNSPVKYSDCPGLSKISERKHLTAGTMESHV